MAPSTPRGLRAAVGFFVVAGLLEIVLVVVGVRPLTVGAAWEALGRAGLDWLLAMGLWRRIALCRTVAMIYCLAALVTDAVVVSLALAHAPVRFPPRVLVQTIYEVPCCVLLLPYLRSKQASLLFARPSL